jgi:uncharacterized membrane protein (DUF4010 family)
MNDLELVGRIGLALALGILVGIERGWHAREEPEGSRVAGVRSFALSGLLGGLAGALGERLGEMLLATIFLGHAAVMILFRLRASAVRPDYGSTTTIAALVTFALGALAVRGPMEVAAAGAVLTALLLGIKPALHGWLARLEYGELMATLKLLAMSVVLLPVLPDRGFGPWQALNPYELWWMVVLVAGLSYAGYVAATIAGARLGTIIAALAGGLVSSTAVTATLARRVRTAPDNAGFLAGAAALASATLYPRLIVILAVFGPQLLPSALVPLLAGALSSYAMAAIALGAGQRPATAESLAPRNPFEFGLALRFGMLLAGVILLSHALEAWYGAAGLYALAAGSGLTDVDALALAIARKAADGLDPGLAVSGILVAVAANTLAKTGFAFHLGSAAFARRVFALTAPPAMAAALAYILV